MESSSDLRTEWKNESEKDRKLILFSKKNPELSKIVTSISSVFHVLSGKKLADENKKIEYQKLRNNSDMIVNRTLSRPLLKPLGKNELSTIIKVYSAGNLSKADIKRYKDALTMSIKLEKMTLAHKKSGSLGSKKSGSLGSKKSSSLGSKKSSSLGSKKSSSLGSKKSSSLGSLMTSSLQRRPTIY